MLGVTWELGAQVCVWPSLDFASPPPSGHGEGGFSGSASVLPFSRVTDHTEGLLVPLGPGSLVQDIMGVVFWRWGQEGRP